MNRKKILKIALFVVLIILSLEGGFILGKGINKKVNIYIDASRFTGVNIRVISTQRMPGIGTSYGLVIKNTSPNIIKQNSVYVSYPIKISGNGYMMNKCKVEATGNKIDIKPDEEVKLNVFISYENYENNNKIDSNRPEFEISGYIDEISKLTHFDQSGVFPK